MTISLLPRRQARFMSDLVNIHGSYPGRLAIELGMSCAPRQPKPNGRSSVQIGPAPLPRRSQLLARSQRNDRCPTGHLEDLTSTVFSVDHLP